MSRVRLAFLWHMHQPSYRDPDSGAFLLPWVRLHAARAYNDMAFLLERHPSIRCTVNFTPVLLEQIEAAAAGAPDRFLEVSRKPPGDLDTGERQALLRSFFMVDWETSVRPVPRYWDLLQKRGHDLRAVDLAAVARTFSDEELGDLQVLFNLAWLGFAAREEEPGLAALARKGRGYSRADCELVLGAQQRILAGVIERWRHLSARGQVELSSTPYYHPILPLLCDSDSARRALPATPLPPRFAWPEDARQQVRRAQARHAAAFGAAPRGMWPAEGSVSPEALEVLAGEGVGWAASDEAVLFHSLPADADRTRSLYRPWRVAAGEGELAMLFRDRGLSDLIGFTYARTAAPAAAADLCSHLEAIGRSWEAAGGEGPATVGVFLDGENPWEHFARSGRDFLEELYQALENDPHLQTATMAEATADAAGPPIARIHSGSWIESSFRIWMGHEEDRRAWAALGRAREALARAEAAGSRPADVLARARELILVAEGSDWFWWYGDDFDTELALEFDGLFRSHLVRACELLGAPVPVELLDPIKRVGLPAGAEGGLVREPTLLLTPSLDGLETTYFEWQGAGLYRPTPSRGAMFGGSQAFRALHLGFDLHSLFLRLDPAESPQRAAEQAGGLRVEIRGGEPALAVDFELAADGASRPGRRAQAAVPDGAADLGQLCFARVVELGLPFAALGLRPGTRVAVAVHVRRGAVAVERLPRTGYLAFTVPDEDFERVHWRV